MWVGREESAVSSLLQVKQVASRELKGLIYHTCLPCTILFILPKQALLISSRANSIMLRSESPSSLYSLESTAYVVGISAINAGSIVLMSDTAPFKPQ